MQKYEAVIFDLDGTLIDSMWVWDEIDKTFLAELNLEVPNDLDKALEGKSFTETAVYFKERFKLKMSVDEIKLRWHEMAYDFYVTKVPLKKGAREFLGWLKQENVKIGIATSNSRELVQEVLKALDIEIYFDEIRISCEVGKGKPFPDIYLKVAKELEVEPKHCLVFEDIPNGVRAGKKAGMTVWAIEDGQKVEIKNELNRLADDYVTCYIEAKNKLIAG